jgi:hypothetical protein
METPIVAHDVVRDDAYSNTNKFWLDVEPPRLQCDAAGACLADGRAEYSMLRRIDPARRRCQRAVGSPHPVSYQKARNHCLKVARISPWRSPSGAHQADWLVCWKATAQEIALREKEKASRFNVDEPRSPWSRPVIAPGAKRARSTQTTLV